MIINFKNNKMIIILLTLLLIASILSYSFISKKIEGFDNTDDCPLANIFDNNFIPMSQDVDDTYGIGTTTTCILTYDSTNIHKSIKFKIDGTNILNSISDIYSNEEVHSEPYKFLLRNSNDYDYYIKCKNNNWRFIKSDTHNSSRNSLSIKIENKDSQIDDISCTTTISTGNEIYEGNFLIKFNFGYPSNSYPVFIDEYKINSVNLNNNSNLKLNIKSSDSPSCNIVKNNKLVGENELLDVIKEELRKNSINNPNLIRNNRQNNERRRNRQNLRRNRQNLRRNRQNLGRNNTEVLIDYLLSNDDYNLHNYNSPIYNDYSIFETAMNNPSNPLVNPIDTLNPIQYAQTLFGPTFTPMMAKNSALISNSCEKVNRDSNENNKDNDVNSIETDIDSNELKTKLNNNNVDLINRDKSIFLNDKQNSLHSNSNSNTNTNPNTNSNSNSKLNSNRKSNSNRNTDSILNSKSVNNSRINFNSDSNFNSNSNSIQNYRLDFDENTNTLSDKPTTNAPRPMLANFSSFGF